MIETAPYFSICIPQYNRTDFLIAACHTFASQTFRDFELCISDDLSDDGKASELLAYLEQSGMRYVYRRNETNVRYDANLRGAIALSSGRYLLLMGNDDGLALPDALQRIHNELERARGIAVAIANYREVSTGRVYRRMLNTASLGSGAPLAVRQFRNFSFVSGLIFSGKEARSLATPEVDGSEMYQMYLGVRLLTEEGGLLSLADVLIDKDLQVAGKKVDSYRQRSRIDPCPIIKRHLPMGKILSVVAEGLKPLRNEADRERLLYEAACDLYLYTYSFWAVEYRRVQSWRYALGVLLALSPSDIAPRGAFAAWSRTKLWALYLATTLIGLLTPIFVFDALRARLYAFAKGGQ